MNLEMPGKKYLFPGEVIKYVYQNDLYNFELREMGIVCFNRLLEHLKRAHDLLNVQIA